MRVLLDECAPKALKRYLIGHGLESRTVQEVGWSGKQNGELLALAEAHYDVFVTIDTNLRYQQNLAARKIAVAVLLSFSNRLEDLRAYFPAVALAVKKIMPAKSLRSATFLEHSFALILLGLYRYRNSLLSMDKELIFEEPQNNWT